MMMWRLCPLFREAKRLAAVVGVVDAIQKAHDRIGQASARHAALRAGRVNEVLQEIGRTESAVSADALVVEGRLRDLEQRLALLRTRLKEFSLW